MKTDQDQIKIGTSDPVYLQMESQTYVPGQIPIYHVCMSDIPPLTFSVLFSIFIHNLSLYNIITVLYRRIKREEKKAKSTSNGLNIFLNITVLQECYTSK
jgi:hypothetical protein